MKKYLFMLLVISFVPALLLAKSPVKASPAEESYQQGKALYDKKEYDKAFPFMLKAAEAGHSDAQMHVGKMYYNGWGVKHSHAKGLEWHKKAAAQGNKESQAKLKKMDHH